MPVIRFVHCSDLHIDTPFKGLTELHPDLRDLLYQSTYQSFSNVIELAVSNQVDFVAISGDVYDSADKSLQAQLRFRNGLDKLAQAGIPAFVAHGNHDPLDSWSVSLQWPETVKVFGGDEVECGDIEREGRVVAKVYGISYKTRDVFDNLALKFRHNESDVPAIALLHANVGDNTGHDAYAPASINDFLGRGIAYWALGHVHQKSILRQDNPAIVYPGNTQSRHPREAGAKGCYLVELRENRTLDPEFVATDTVRFASRSIDVSGTSDIDVLTLQILSACDEARKDAAGRTLILRLTLMGRTPLHAELRMGANLSELKKVIQEQLMQHEPIVWLDQLLLKTGAPYDVDELRRGSDFAAELIALYDNLRDTKCEYWNAIDSDLDALFVSWRGRRVLRKPSREELLQLTEEALHWTLEGIVEDE